MSNREEETLDQSSNTTGDENKYFGPLKFSDIHSHNGITLQLSTSGSQNQDENPIFELEEELNNRLAQLKIDGMDNLSEKIEQTKERIKDYRKDDKEQIEKETQILTQMKHLKLLDGTITELKSTESIEGSSSVMELYRLEQELINIQAKLKVDDVNSLSEKIQYTEQLMKDYREDGREEETEDKMEILTQLKHLKLLDGTIKELKTTRSVEESNSVKELCWLEQELINGLAKLKIDNANKLSEKTQQTKERIEHYRGNGRQEDAEKELAQLEYLKLLDDTITKLKPTGLVIGSSSVMESVRLGEELPARPERSHTSSGHDIESNDYFTPSGGNKRFWSNGTFDQSAKRSRKELGTKPLPKFFVHLHEVKYVSCNHLRPNIQEKYRRLCKWDHYGFPGCHPVYMHLGNYKKILESPYMVTWRSVGKRYMMLIEGRDKVYMLDEGYDVFNVDHIQFPFDSEYTSHLKDTLVVGEFVIDNSDGLFKPSFWINDIITYSGEDVSKKPFPDRLKLFSESIVRIRDSAIAKGRIQKTTQPFLIRNKYFFGLSTLNKLLSPTFLVTIPHKVEGLFFLPEKDPYTPGECQNVLKWKENLTIEFRLKITGNSSHIGTVLKKQGQLFVSCKRTDIFFDTIPYSTDLEEYDNKIISCSYKDNQWHFHRLRDDKPFPNSEKTANSVMGALKRPVTREVLCDLIKNHVHG